MKECPHTTVSCSRARNKTLISLVPRENSQLCFFGRKAKHLIMPLNMHNQIILSLLWSKHSQSVEEKLTRIVIAHLKGDEVYAISQMTQEQLEAQSGESLQYISSKALLSSKFIFPADHISYKKYTFECLFQRKSTTSFHPSSLCLCVSLGK